MATGETLGTIETANVDTVSLAYSPDGKTLAGMQWQHHQKSSGKATVSLWEATARTLQTSLDLPELGSSLLQSLQAQVLFHPRDGSLVTVAGRYAQRTHPADHVLDV